MQKKQERRTSHRPVYLCLFWLVHFAQDFFCMRLESCKAGGLGGRWWLFLLLCFLLPSILDFWHLGGFGGFGNLWGLGGFGRFGGLGGFGGFLPGLLSAGRRDVGWRHRLLRLRVSGRSLLHRQLQTGLTLHHFGCILQTKPIITCYKSNLNKSNGWT